MLRVGDTAPQFELKDQSGNIVKLSDYKGKKVLVAFYVFAFSSVCTVEMTDILADLAKFSAKGTSVVGISVDSHHANRAFAEQLQATFPLLSDFSKETSMAYGVLRAEGFSDRAYFVIDGQGKVTFAHVMDVPSNKLDNAKLLDALR